MNFSGKCKTLKIYIGEDSKYLMLLSNLEKFTHNHPKRYDIYLPEDIKENLYEKFG